MKNISFEAFTDELEKIAGAKSYAAGVGRNMVGAIKSLKNPVKAVREGWKSDSGLGKNITVFSAGATAPSAFKEKDENRPNLSRAERVGSWAGETLGGVAGNKFGLSGALAAGIAGGAAGRLAGKAVNRVAKGQPKKDGAR